MDKFHPKKILVLQIDIAAQFGKQMLLLAPMSYMLSKTKNSMIFLSNIYDQFV
jgi:hypothetical protein